MTDETDGGAQVYLLDHTRRVECIDLAFVKEYNRANNRIFDDDEQDMRMEEELSESKGRRLKALIRSSYRLPPGSCGRE